ncbi:hypothetical protein BDV95DRAFT_391722 [Massariosphaeria phaeospora]|uniref:Uncharacterized protein n=1 Tax=Massariosphaeria phaeospora TaxID=100035 RepID=A0A7C8IGW4_9PLEO|nr:hypothetical protein BDV95DRAFT_391722 [Massariosphaeria phaeospora]
MAERNRTGKTNTRTGDSQRQPQPRKVQHEVVDLGSASESDSPVATDRDSRTIRDKGKRPVSTDTRTTQNAQAASNASKRHPSYQEIDEQLSLDSKQMSTLRENMENIMSARQCLGTLDFRRDRKTSNLMIEAIVTETLDAVNFGWSDELIESTKRPALRAAARNLNDIKKLAIVRARREAQRAETEAQTATETTTETIMETTMEPATGESVDRGPPTKLRDLAALEDRIVQLSEDLEKLRKQRTDSIGALTGDEAGLWLEFSERHPMNDDYV